MKKIALLLTLFAGAIGLQSCTIQEEYVQNSTAEVFEMTTNFTYNNNYSAVFNFNPAIYDSDHVLVYRLWGQDGGDVWRLVPNTVFFTNGDEILYNFDHTRYDFRVFLEPNFNVESLTNQQKNSYLANQTFRIVIIPGDFNYKMDFSNYENTIQALGLENSTVKKLQQK